MVAGKTGFGGGGKQTEKVTKGLYVVHGTLFSEECVYQIGKILTVGIEENTIFIRL